MSVQANLRSFMMKGESMLALAKRLDWSSYSTLRDILVGHTKHPREEVVEELAKKLGTSPAYLRYGIGPKFIDQSSEFAQREARGRTENRQTAN